MKRREGRAAKAAATRKSNEEIKRSVAEELRASRRAALTAALSAAGLTLRSDSSLCEMYLQSGEACGWTIPRIVKRMCQMKWLHEYTSYATELRDIRAACRDAGEWWDAQETQDSAEHCVVSEHGGWPSVWPWQAQNANEDYTPSNSASSVSPVAPDSLLPDEAIASNVPEPEPKVKHEGRAEGVKPEMKSEVKAEVKPETAPFPLCPVKSE